MSSVLDYILRTNLFNFIIFAGIIAFLYRKLDVSGKLDNAKNEVRKNVEGSEGAKNVSQEHLSKIEDKIAHLQDEIEEIVSKSLGNAKLVGKQIISDARQSAKNIKENSKKMIENRNAILKNDLLKRASLASIEVAKSHIISELNNNADLHNKLIDESIEAIGMMEEN